MQLFVADLVGSKATIDTVDPTEDRLRARRRFFLDVSRDERPDFLDASLPESVPTDAKLEHDSCPLSDEYNVLSSPPSCPFC